MNEQNEIARNLPIGIRDFKEIREKGYLYVDKTDMIMRMVPRPSEAY